MGFNLPVLNRRRRLLGTATPIFSPATLFSLSEPGLWLDPSDVANLAWRRNLLTFTEQFDNAAWSKSNATVTANTAVAPDGTTTADRLVEAATTSFHGINPPLTTKTTQTWSIYAKEAERRYVIVTLGEANTATLGGGIFVDLRDGTVLSATGAKLVSHAVTSAGGDWYRCSVTVNSTGAATDPFPFVFMSDNSTHTIGANYGSKSYAGNTANGILIWGAQLETGTLTDYQRITDVNTEVIERFPSATLYQDPAGTIPVTGPAQTVGLALDKSKGLVLGSELVTNGDFSSGTTGWTGSSSTLSVVNSRLVVTPTTTNPTAFTSFTTVVGRSYRVAAQLISVNGGTSARFLQAGNTSSGNTLLSLNVGTTPGSYSAVFTATATTTFLHVYTFDGTNATVWDNISVKELPGNHAVQTGLSTLRPTYGIVPVGGRRNLLSRTEEFDTASWAKDSCTVPSTQYLAPDGTLTADRVVSANATAVTGVGQSLASAISASAVYTASYYVQANGARYIQVLWSGGLSTNFANFDLQNPTAPTGGTYTAATISAAANGFYRITITSTLAAASGGSFLWLLDSGTAGRGSSFTGNGTSGILIWGAQLETGSSATNYQRVGSAFDVTEAGVASLSYLSFDGVDDFMVTPTITPGIDRAQVFAGVRKLSDAATAHLAELGTGTQTGSFYLAAPNTVVPASYLWAPRGTSTVLASATGFAAPVTSVVTGIADISGDVSTIRVNGTQAATSSANQGTGSFGNYALYIGRQAGGLFPFNGNLFSLIVRFGTNLDAGTITSTETWVGGKSGFAVPTITGVPTIGVA